MLREAPELQLIDLSHAIPAQDVALAGLFLARSYGWFSSGTVHLCVVDPGVGSAREPLVAEADGHLFVAPDNGVLTQVLVNARAPTVRRIDLARLGLDPPSRTFHARDVFAPVAAWLATGLRPFSGLGPLHAPMMNAEDPPLRDTTELRGRVMFVDHFGNLVTNLPAEWLPPGEVRVFIGDSSLRVVGTYAEARPGECVGLVSSFDTLEVALRDGSAASRLAVTRGAAVRVARVAEGA